MLAKCPPQHSEDPFTVGVEHSRMSCSPDVPDMHPTLHNKKNDSSEHDTFLYISVASQTHIRLCIERFVYCNSTVIARYTVLADTV